MQIGKYANVLTQRTEGDQSQESGPKASFKKRLYRFLTGKDGSEAEVIAQAESSEAIGEVHGRDNDGQASVKSRQSANSAYITVAAKDVPSNVLSDKDRHSISPEALLKFKVEVHPALRDQLSGNEATASMTPLETAMREGHVTPSFVAPSDAPRPTSSVYSLSGESPSPVSSSSQRDQVSDESGEKRSDEQDDKERGAGPVLPELNFRLSMNDFSEVLGLVDESKLVLVEQTHQTATNESATSVKAKGNASLEPKGLEPAGDARSETIQGNQTRQLGRNHPESQAQPEVPTSHILTAGNPEEGAKSWSTPGSSSPPYQGQLAERSPSPSSMEAVKDSSSSGNVSLEDESHPGPAHGLTGEGLGFREAVSSSNKYVGHGAGRFVEKKPIAAAPVTRRTKENLPCPGPAGASKAKAGPAPPTPAAASGPTGGIAESKVHILGTHPETPKANTGLPPLTLEQWQQHFCSLQQRSSPQSPASYKNPVHSPTSEQFSEPSISPRTSSLRSPSSATYSAFPSSGTITSSPTYPKARLATPPSASPGEVPPYSPAPRSFSGTTSRTPTSAGFEPAISSKLRQVSVPTTTPSPRQPSPTNLLAPAPTASKVAAKRRLFEQLPIIEERSPTKEEKEVHQGNSSLAFTGTSLSSFAPSFIPIPTTRPPSTSTSPETRQSTLTNNLLQGTVSKPRDHQPATQLGAELPRYSSVEAATRSLDIIASRREQQSENQDHRAGRRRLFTPPSLSTVTEEINSELQECASTYGVEEELTRQDQLAQQTRSFSHGAAPAEQPAPPYLPPPYYTSLQHQGTPAYTPPEVPPIIPALRSTKSSGDLPQSPATRSSAHSAPHSKTPFTRAPKAIDRPRIPTAPTGIASPSQYSSSPTVRSFSQEAHLTTPHLHITDEMGQCLSKCCGGRGEEDQVLPTGHDQPAAPAAPRTPSRSPPRTPLGTPPRSAPIPIPPRSRARGGDFFTTPTTGHPSKDRDREQYMRAALRPSASEGAGQGGGFPTREDNPYSSAFADDELRGRHARSRETVYLRPLPPARLPPSPPCPAEATESVSAEFDDLTMGGSILPSEVTAASTPRRTRAVDPETASKSSSKGSNKSHKTRKSVRSTKTAKSTKSAKSVKSAKSTRSTSTPASIRSQGPSPSAAGHGMLTPWFYEVNSETEEETRRLHQEKERARKEQKLQKKASDRALRDARKEAKAAEGGPALGADYAAAWESLRGALPFGKTKTSASEAKGRRKG